MINTFLTVFATMQLHSSIVKFFLVFKDDEFKQKQYLTSLLVVSVFISIVFLSFIYYFLDEIKVLFELEKLSNRLVLLGLLISFINGFKVFYESINRILQHAKDVLVSNILATIVLVGCSYIFLKYYDMNLYGIVLATFISSVVALVYYMIINKKHFVLSVDFELIKEPTKFAIGLIPHTLSKNIYVLADRFILIKFVSMSDVGIYAIIDKVANMLKLMTSNFGKAFTPFFMTNNSNAVSMNLSQMILITNYIFLGFLLSLTLFSKLILNFIQDGLEVYAYLTVVLSTAFIFKNLEMYLTNFLLDNKQTKYISIISFSAAILNIVLNLIFIPIYGIVAATISTTISYFIGFIVAYYYVDRKFKYFEFPFLKVTLDFLFVGILVLLTYFYQNLYGLGFMILYLGYGYFKYFYILKEKLIKRLKR
jgi:O-antigen/teichoic acid export membrane protein